MRLGHPVIPLKISDFRQLAARLGQQAIVGRRPSLPYDANQYLTIPCHHDNVLHMVEANPGATNELIFEIFRVNGRVLATGDALVADLGLTSARWQVLGAIELSAMPIPVAQVARNMGLTRQAVQRLTNEMVSDGLLEFADNPNHRRARLVNLTEAGKQVYKAAVCRWSIWETELMALLGDQTINEMTENLRKIRDRLERNSVNQSAHA